MTEKEQKSVDNLLKLLEDIKKENIEFKETIEKQILEMNKKVDKKLIPLNFEMDILQTLQQSLQETIKTTLTGFNSPLSKLIIEVVNNHHLKLKDIISNSFNQAIDTEEFKKSIVNAFSHKISRSIISNNDGLFDKVSNDLKQDTIFKSKMALAVANVVDECLIKKNN